MRRFPLILVLILLALCLYWILPTRTDETSPKGPVRESEDGALEQRIARPEWALENEAVAFLPEPKGAAEGALSNDYTLHFADADAMERFLASAAGAGLKILGAQETLLAVRVSATREELSPFWEDGMELGFNYPVRLPLFPPPQNLDTSALSGFSSAALNFLGAEDALNEGWGAGVTVAVLDTGWTAHPDLSGKRLRLIDLLEGSESGDYAGHGTAVLGLIASTNEFAPGIAPGSDLLAVRVLDADGHGNTFTLADGIVRAVDAGADVINLSLGAYGDSDLLRSAVLYAESKGVLLVAASGNDGAGLLTYPAAYPTVLGVGAIDANGNLAPFSNYGESLDLVAPGFGVNALWEEGSYVSFNGTSASAPLVAGMAARILESNPNQSPADVRALLMTYANDTGPPGSDPYYGAGVLNATRLENAGTPGIVDLALADIYPAVEEGDGTTFPLYVSVQNRGTTAVANALMELTVDGTPYFHRFSALSVGEVGYVQLPMSADMFGEKSMAVEARVKPGERYMDTNAANDSGAVILGPPPGG